jgi:hypothetical protein
VFIRVTKKDIEKRVRHKFVGRDSVGVRETETTKNMKLGIIRMSKK